MWKINEKICKLLKISFSLKNIWLIIIINIKWLNSPFDISWKSDVIQIIDFNIWQNTPESSALCLCPYLELWGEEIILSDQKQGDKEKL